jgi:hypothetical protein
MIYSSVCSLKKVTGFWVKMEMEETSPTEMTMTKVPITIKMLQRGKEWYGMSKILALMIQLPVWERMRARRALTNPSRAFSSVKTFSIKLLRAPRILK